MHPYESLINSINENMRAALEAQQQSHQSLLQRQAMLHNNLVAHLSKPKEVMRDDNGKIIGVK
jgi:hypothetical protein